ncbi:MAG: EcoKI restriction-modification system protein HsdS [Synergistetes bacterium ADurb.Bin520]|nr:MAG: EcoKI restriction-modification system protein HsdS [Synergistetes bacterium ADurb.Bin520]
MGSEWTKVSIGEVAEVFDGPHATPKTTDSGPIFLGIGSLQNGRINLGETRHVTPEDFKAWTRRVKPQAGDVVFSYETRLGEAAIIPKGLECCLGRRMGLVRTDENKMLPRYFLYLYISPYFQDLIKRKTIQGATVDRIALKEFPNFPIPLPPLPEQRAIAHILGTLDDKIELNRRMNQTLEEMARALFKSWFVDFDPVRAKVEGRETGLPEEISALFPDEFEDSELGEVPLNWPIEELGAQLDVLETGRRPKGGVGSFLEGVPSVGAESILGVGLFDYEKTKYITEDFFVSMRSGRAESMDVMLYKDGGKPGDFRPRVSMFGRKFPFERFAINEHIFRIRSKILGQAFLYLQLSHERILNDLHNRGGKAAIPGINQAEVKTLRLPIPPREALSRFNEIVTPMMESILDRAVQSRALASLRDTLLLKLISGELRIEDAEKFVEASGA